MAEQTLRIGARIAASRKDVNLTQADLAAKLPGKTTGDQVSKWERGIHRPGDDTLEHIARIVKRDISWFLLPEPEPDPDPPETVVLDEAHDLSQLARIETELRAVKKQLGDQQRTLHQLLSLFTREPNATATIADAIARAVEEAMVQRAREASRQGRRRVPHPPEVDERPAA